MRKKYYLSLLIIPVIAISLAMISMPATAADGDVTFDITAYYYATSGIIPGVSPDPVPPYYGYVGVSVYVDASALPDMTDAGMMGWGLKVIIDPTVLAPYGAAGGDEGYFLYDWSASNWPAPPFPPGMPIPYETEFLVSTGTDYIECTEMFLEVPTGAGGTGKLCDLYFLSLSENAYTEITIDAAGSGYQEKSGDKYAIYGIDGHYNAPTNAMFLEQYSGSTWPTGDPTYTDWHELDPVYCTAWTMESWLDQGDGKLSPSDQVDMMRSSDPEPLWFHVEWVNPYGTAGDGIADMWVTEKIPEPEFPLGSVAPIALIAAVAYIWWVTRRKRLEVT